MKIDIFSDLHLDHWMTKIYKGERTTQVLRNFIEAGKSDANVVIFAGDAGNGYNWYELVVKTLGEYYNKVIATPGNHCHYGSPGRFFGESYKTGLYMNTQWASCPLWTNFREQKGFGELAEQSISDWTRIPELKSWIDMYERYHAYRELLLSEQGLELVVTHFAPIVQSIHPMYAGDALNTYFCNDDEELFSKVGAKLWVHGHTHSEFDYVHNKTRVVAHPIGYPYENYKELIGIPMKTVEI